jgi:hypothetical protein
VRSPADLRDQAWTLHCQGLRSPAIAKQLHVPERTVRDWLQRLKERLAEEAQETEEAAETAASGTGNDDKAADSARANHTAQRALAVERHLAVAVAAWADHDRLTTLAERAADHDDFAAAARLFAIAARALSVALAAQRAVARLYGLHLAPPLPDQRVELHIACHPDGPVDLDALRAQHEAEVTAARAKRDAAWEAEDAAFDATYPSFGSENAEDAREAGGEYEAENKAFTSEDANATDPAIENPAISATHPPSTAPSPEEGRDQRPAEPEGRRAVPTEPFHGGAGAEDPLPPPDPVGDLGGVGAMLLDVAAEIV